jgi:hypothetical protein
MRVYLLFPIHVSVDADVAAVRVPFKVAFEREFSERQPIAIDYGRVIALNFWSKRSFARRNAALEHENYRLHLL